MAVRLAALLASAALGNHDVAEENRLTCDKYQGRAQRRVNSYPKSTMDYFGSPEEFAGSGVSAATYRLSAMLAPVSKDTAQALATAIIKQDRGSRPSMRPAWSAATTPPNQCREGSFVRATLPPHTRL